MGKSSAARSFECDEPDQDFVTENQRYENWLKDQCDIVGFDLDYKHRRMRKNAFVFLRATFFRWAKQICVKCPDLKTAPYVDAVGDLHTENFGTWRDSDSRLVWGINDFDDADAMPYAYDLVRLATSAVLAAEHTKRGRLNSKETADAILLGYRRGLEAPGPTLPHENAQVLLPVIRFNTKHFYSDLLDPEACPLKKPPSAVALALRKSLPDKASPPEFRARLKVGGGGLGRPRYVAIARWQAGHVAREAKAWVPSAWSYANGTKSAPSTFLSRAHGVNRSPDPKLDIDDKSGFIIRRIAADSHKLRLGDNPGSRLTEKVLSAMGVETAAIHATKAPTAEAVERDLIGRPRDWLVEAAETMRAAVKADFHAWKEFSGS